VSDNGPEPSNWELGRSIARVENAVNGLGARLEAKFDGLAATYVTRPEHDNLVTQVQDLKTGNEKRLDRVFNVWLAMGGVFLTAVAGIIVSLVTR